MIAVIGNETFLAGGGMLERSHSKFNRYKPYKDSSCADIHAFTSIRYHIGC